MSEEFERNDLPASFAVEAHKAAYVAVHEITDIAARKAGWIKTAEPCEGDAIYLTQGKRRTTHIGVVVVQKEKLLVLHARKGIGVVLSDMLSLKLNHLKEVGYWRYANIS